MGGPVRSSVLKRIILLAREGHRAGEIAEMVGRPVGTVYNYLSAARRAGEDVPRCRTRVPDEAIEPSVITLDPKVRRALAGPARLRGLVPEALAARLLSTIARDGLVDAVLDDGDPR